MTKTQQKQEATFIAGMILGLRYATENNNHGEPFDKVNDIIADRYSRFLGDALASHSLENLAAACPAPGDKVILRGIYTAYMNR